MSSPGVSLAIFRAGDSRLKRSQIHRSRQSCQFFMDAADAAVVWVPPSTNYPPTDIVSGIHTVEYTVPAERTGGGTPRLRAQVVNPFLMCREPFEADCVEAGFIRAFSQAPPTSDLGVVSKYQETMKFLEAARAAWGRTGREGHVASLRRPAAARHRIICKQLREVCVPTRLLLRQRSSYELRGLPSRCTL